MPKTQINNEKLFPLCVDFIQGFRESNPEVRASVCPPSLEGFKFIMNRWNLTISKKELAAIVDTWEKGWDSLPEEVKRQVQYWRYNRCITL